MPNYTIKCWDDKSFDFESVSFVRDAMAAKKYAFAADYVRLYALYTEGGIYLDTDVLVKKDFNHLLSNDFFCGTEAFWRNQELQYRIEPAIMGSVKEHPFIAKCMSFYHETAFSVEKMGNEIIMPEVISRHAKALGYQYKNILQHLPGVTIYPTSYFTNTLHPDTSDENNLYAIHQNAGSWIDYSNRGWLFRFCKKHDLLNLYHRLERIK